MAASSNLVELAIQFVRLGFLDVLDNESEFRSLSFLTEELTTTELQEVIRTVHSYNAFDGAKIAAALEVFRGKISEWRFGREKDPVLYVRLPHFSSQIECGGRKYNPNRGDRISDVDHQRMIELVRSTFQTLEAEEVSFTDQDRHELRIWWS